MQTGLTKPILRSKDVSEVVKLFNQPIDTQSVCSKCNQCMLPMIILNIVKRNDICMFCGIHEDVVDTWHKPSDVLICYVMTRSGVVRLNRLAVINPLMMTDHYTVTPAVIQRARNNLARKLGMTIMPKSLSLMTVGKDAYVVETGIIPNNNNFVNVLPYVNNHMGIICVHTMWVSNMKLTAWFIEPRIASVSATYSPINRQIRAAADKWEIDEITTKPMQTLSRQYNQLFTEPFSTLRAIISWTWDMQGTKFMISTANGKHMLPSHKFINTMYFLKPTARWIIIRSSSRMTSVTINASSKSRASITIEGTITYKGSSRHYPECMLGLITLLRDSLLMMQPSMLASFRVLKDDAVWQGGVKRSVDI